jgi:hypothetical protein
MSIDLDKKYEKYFLSKFIYMSINLDKKYEKYLSKYNQLFTQMNGSGLTPLESLKKLLISGNIYRESPEEETEHFYYLHRVNDSIYLIPVTSQPIGIDWKKHKYTVKKDEIDKYSEKVKHGITDKELQIALDEGGWCSRFKCLDNIIKPEKGQLYLLKDEKFTII